MKRIVLGLVKAACVASVVLAVVSCGGGKKTEKQEAPPVNIGQMAESNFWAMRVDSVVERVTPGMDRYYLLVYGVVKNITSQDQPFTLQDMALVLAVERHDTSEMVYQIDGIVSQSEMKKFDWPASTTVKAGEETKVILAYSLPKEAKPTLIKFNDGVGAKVTFIRIK